jgi:spermidine synthase
MIRTGLLFGVMNGLVALWTLWLFRHEVRRFSVHVLACVLTLAALGAGFALANRITTLGEEKFYQDAIVFSATSPYQRIVVTHGNGGYRLFLNGNLQFTQRDEYRYHEALVHPALAAFGAPRKVAVLGGGDGMAVREILKYPSVESITLVELDPNMTQLFSEHPQLSALNGGSLKSPKVHIVTADAFQWLQQDGDMFDVIIVDFPDPTNFALGKLYTNSFYALLDKRLSASGYAVVQTTSPLIARRSFWTVVQTIESVGLTATPYHVHVPSFGEWGFVITSRRPWRWPTQLPDGLRFLSPKTLPLMFDFPLDMARVPAQVNRLSNQVLVGTYEEEWGEVTGHN